MNQDMGAMPEQPVAPQSDNSAPPSDGSPFDVYEKLRTAIMELLKQGLPGADQLLLSIDKIQAKNVMQATAEGAGGKQGVASSQAGSQYGKV